MRRFPGAVLEVLFFTALTISVSAQAPPVITKQPVSLSISIGATASFNVTASGNPPPIYQWQRNGEEVSGATNRVFQLRNVQLADAGNYRVIVSNELGAVTSAAAELDVDPAFTEIASPLFTIAGGSSGASWSDVNNDGKIGRAHV